MGMIELVPASAQCLDQYNSLIVRSKSVWAWPEDYLDAALLLLQITPAYLNASHSFEVRFGSKLGGFCALTINGTKPLLDHLWIDPNFMGRGGGRTAVTHLIALAATTDATGMDVWPDPPSEGFLYNDRL
jgi:hypothetical protein